MKGNGTGWTEPKSFDPCRALVSSGRNNNDNDNNNTKIYNARIVTD